MCSSYKDVCLAAVCVYVAVISAVQASVVGLMSEDVCTTETFTAECKDNDIIVVDSAYYGRMELGECASKDMGFIGCKTDVLHIIDRICSGKKKCEFSVPFKDLEDANTCNKELKSYINIVYHCQKVLLPASDNCDNYDYQKNDTITRGNITNQLNSKDPVCGTETQPWIITAKSGQTISLKLIDFSVDLGRGYITAPEYPDNTYTVCRPYVNIRDVVNNENKSICGGHRRVTQIYTSLANQIQISFEKQSAEKNFLISFEIIGCPDKKPPEGVWYKRLSPDQASMGCSSPHAELTWYLHCEGHAWVGPQGNCSAPMYAGFDEGRNKDGGIHIGVAIAIIIFAALVVGSVIVIVGFYRYRRREPGELATNYTTQTLLIRQRPPDQYEMRCTCPVPPTPQKVHETLQRPHRPSPDTRQATLHRSPQVPRHYSLSQTVTVNGNEYEHIWQTPLPKPRSVTTNNSSDQPTTPSRGVNETPSPRATHDKPQSPHIGGGVIGGESPSPRRVSETSSSPPHSPGEHGEYTKYKTDSSDTDRDRPYYIRSKDIYDGSKDDCRTTSTGYSTLRKNNRDNNKSEVISNKPADV